jgi:hypothetical protein
MAFNIVKVVNVVGSVLGIAGTLLTGWAGQKAMKENIAKEVAKALAEKVNQK